MSKPRANRSVKFSSNPLLARPLPAGRSTLLMVLFALGFVMLILRAIWVQIADHEFYEQQGELRFARTLELPAYRGRVLDRNNQILAESAPAKNIWATPQELEVNADQLNSLSRLLNLPSSELSQKLNDKQRSFVWIDRQVSLPVAKEVAALNIKGLYFGSEYKREYPEAEFSSNIVGFTNIADKGQEGIELEFNKALSGRPGSRHVIKDRLGRVIEDIDNEVMPKNGQDIHLSIDSRIQYLAYEDLSEAVQQNKAKAGSVVVLDARSGEVLALANYPTYDPNQRQNLSGSALRNRAVTDAFELGSVMKPITMATALELHRVTPQETINTSPGRYRFAGATISDVSDHGVLTMEGVIEKSSNIGMTVVSQKLSAQEMWHTFTKLGFGQRPEIEFPGASAGRLRSWKSWRPIEQATMAYGYGMSSSLLQLAHAYTAFTNDGMVLPISILKQDKPPVGTYVYSPAVAAEMRHMLWIAAGAGDSKSRTQPPSYSVGGKSGTSREAIGGAYVAGKYRASFAGIAPAEHPRIIVAVTIDAPSNGAYFGAVVSGPVFSKVVEQSLHIMNARPDYLLTHRTDDEKSRHGNVG